MRPSMWNQMASTRVVRNTTAVSGMPIFMHSEALYPPASLPTPTRQDAITCVRV